MSHSDRYRVIIPTAGLDRRAISTDGLDRGPTVTVRRSTVDRWPLLYILLDITIYLVVRSSVVKAVATDLNTYVVCSNPVPCFYFLELHCTHHSARMVSANDKLWIWLKV